MATGQRRLTLSRRCVCASQARGFSAARVVAAEAPAVAAEAPAAVSTTEQWNKISEHVGSKAAGERECCV